eukprot:gene30789-biopygen18216
MTSVAEFSKTSPIQLWRSRLSRPSGLACTAVIALFAAGLAIGGDGAVRAEDGPVVELKLEHHTFTPSDIKVPANKDFFLVVNNLDDAAEEIDSHDLRIEKVIAAKTVGKIRVKALKPGTYKFSGEYHEDTAHGTIVAE